MVFDLDVARTGDLVLLSGRLDVRVAPDVRLQLAEQVAAGTGDLVLDVAGLVADGVTEVSEVHHVDRGYEGFVDKLVALGADVRREAVPPQPWEV